MSKEKAKSLMKYAESIKQKLASPTPGKWQHSPESYKQYLERELKLVNKTLDTFSTTTK